MAQHPAPAPTELLTRLEAAAFLRLSPASIYGLVSRRRLPSVKISGSLRFLRSDPEDLIKAGRRPVAR